MADQSYLVKINLIRHNKCSQSDIAHNSVNCSKNKQCTQTNKQIRTNRWLTHKPPVEYFRGKWW